MPHPGDRPTGRGLRSARGRLTRGQARALERHYGRYCMLVPDSRLDWSALFGRDAPLLLEIGFGTGRALLEWARTHADWNCLGVDPYRPGIGAAILHCVTERIENVRLIEGDARALLERAFAEERLSRVHIYFPDPWPKKRHHKRRLVDASFVALLVPSMQRGAALEIATDWEPYALQMRDVLDAEPRLENVMSRGFATRGARPLTRFEERGLARGHAVFDLRYRRR